MHINNTRVRDKKTNEKVGNHVFILNYERNVTKKRGAAKFNGHSIN